MNLRTLDFSLRPIELSNPRGLPKALVLAIAYLRIKREARQWYGYFSGMGKLYHDGILKIEKAVSLDTLNQLRAIEEKPDPKYANTWTAQLPAIPKDLKLFVPIIENYYQRPPLLRNAPLIQFILPKSKDEQPNGRWHVDHLHQVSMMLLLSKVTEQTTHMVYAVGSHKGLKPEGYYDPVQVERRFQPILQLIGEPGTLFIYDTAGLHRANYQPGTVRKVLHLNFTTGHDVE